MDVHVQKEMIISSMWWRSPVSVTIYLNEYQLYNVISKNQETCVKRKLLCRTEYYFYEEVEEDHIEKVVVLITDSNGCLCFKKTYNKVDNVNRKYYSTRSVHHQLNSSCRCLFPYLFQQSISDWKVCFWRYY